MFKVLWKHSDWLAQICGCCLTSLKRNALFSIIPPAHSIFSPFHSLHFCFNSSLLWGIWSCRVCISAFLTCWQALNCLSPISGLTLSGVKHEHTHTQNQETLCKFLYYFLTYFLKGRTYGTLQGPQENSLGDSIFSQWMYRWHFTSHT